VCDCGREVECGSCAKGQWGSKKKNGYWTESEIGSCVKLDGLITEERDKYSFA
jgi:hypothetical protein